MTSARRIVLAATLASATVVLAACETTAPPVAQISGVQGVVLTPAEFELVRRVVTDALAEPSGAYFHPDPAAGRSGSLVAVCGRLNGTNRDFYTTDAIYIVTIDYASGAPRAELVALGGSSSSRPDRELETFCRTELGLAI